MVHSQIADSLWIFNYEPAAFNYQLKKSMINIYTINHGLLTLDSRLRTNYGLSSVSSKPQVFPFSVAGTPLVIQAGAFAPFK